jgi:hypothetical protein
MQRRVVRLSSKAVIKCAECFDASPYCIELEKRIEGTRAELKWHEALSRL